MRKRIISLKKLHCCQRIQALYHDSHGVMGRRKMRAFLQREGISLSKTTVHKYMNRELQLHSICRRKRPAYHRRLVHKIFPNLLKRNFSPKQPNRVWCTDFTYMTLTNGTIRYNCSIIDLYDRIVVASENSSFITSSLVVRTLEKCWWVQRLSHKTWFCNRIKEVSLLPQSSYDIVGSAGFLKAWAVRAVRMKMHRWNAITIL